MGYGAVHWQHPHHVGPENHHDFGVWVSHKCAITRKYKFCVHCVICILKTWLLSTIYRNFQTGSFDSEISEYLKIILLQAKH